MHIEPCPFCQGNHLHISNHLFSHSVACESCKASGPHRRLLDDALRDWNHASKLLRKSRAAAPTQVFGKLDDVEEAVRNLARALRHGQGPLKPPSGHTGNV